MLNGKWDDVVTLELLRCKICGEPLYTPNYGDTLRDKLDHTMEALCSKHLRTHAARVWPNLRPGRTKPEGETE